MPKVRWMRWVVGGAVVALVIVAIALLLAPRPVDADVAKVVRGPIADAVADQGYAQVRDAYVVAAPVAGRLQRIDLRVGDHVTAGTTVVARIWPATADLLDPRARARAEAARTAAGAAVAAAVAHREQAAAMSTRADQEVRRLRALAAQGYATRQALEAGEAEARAAGADLRAAVAELGVRRAELAAAEASLLEPEVAGRRALAVTSPASGYVTRVLQQSERTVVVGAPMVEIGDQRGLEAAIEFLTQDAVRIREGMAAEVFDWGGEGVIPALVRRVEPQGFTKVSALGVEEQRVLVLLQFTGDPQRWSRLGPGYRLWGRVFLRREPQAVTAPLGALVRDGRRWAVYRVDGDRARLVPVDVGAMTDAAAEIRRGLAAGDTVVVFPSDKLADGVRLRTRVRN